MERYSSVVYKKVSKNPCKLQITSDMKPKQQKFAKLCKFAISKTLKYEN